MRRTSSKILTLSASIAIGLAIMLGGILKGCVNSQAVYPLFEQDGLGAQERGYTTHEQGNHRERVGTAPTMRPQRPWSGTGTA